jgi:hypothetical protein
MLQKIVVSPRAEEKIPEDQYLPLITYSICSQCDRTVPMFERSSCQDSFLEKLKGV